jgi:hypothetical protein
VERFEHQQRADQGQELVATIGEHVEVTLHHVETQEPRDGCQVSRLNRAEAAKEELDGVMNFVTTRSTQWRKSGTHQR